MLLIAAGRFEEPKDVITEPVTEDDEEVVTGVTPSSDPLPLDPVTPIATDEYDGEPLTTLAVLLVEDGFEASDDASGNSCLFAGVGGFTTPEAPPAFPVPPDVFLVVDEATGATVEWELLVATWAAANGTFLLLLEVVCVVIAQRAVLGM